MAKKKIIQTFLSIYNFFYQHFQQTVESFKLMQTAIEHFLTPNMALLMDKDDGSGMENLGPTIYRRLHDISWEVRDSVLELLHAIVEISNESKLFYLFFHLDFFKSDFFQNIRHSRNKF